MIGDILKQLVDAGWDIELSRAADTVLVLIRRRIRSPRHDVADAIESHSISGPDLEYAMLRLRKVMDLKDT